MYAAKGDKKKAMQNLQEAKKIYGKIGNEKRSKDAKELLEEMKSK